MFLPCDCLKGDKYVLRVLDNFSRYAEVICINKKNAVTDEIISVIHRLRRQTGYTVKAVRTDHGTE
jgi:hypothetical protein